MTSESFLKVFSFGEECVQLCVFVVSQVNFFSKARLLNDQRRFLVFPVGGECVFVVGQVKIFFPKPGCSMTSDGF